MLETNPRYLPFGTSGALIFISDAHKNGKTDVSVLLDEINKKDIGTVCVIAGTPGFDRETLDAVNPLVSILSIVIPPGPETNDSIYSAYQKIQRFLKRGNLLFLVEPNSESRFPSILGKLLLSSDPGLDGQELSDRISRFGYSVPDSDPSIFRKFLSHKKEGLTHSESTGTEFSVSTAAVSDRNVR
uniref:Uncharacterized protein n=1 Tax=Leptospira ellisii TaxID=2023197 RepID=A0A2N0B3U6_9LEPT|nr:hypothetical protein [Leptospira ellisii]PJZ91214.1 hypothetical protein CH379_19890 [Leptospira ellisii]